MSELEDLVGSGLWRLSDDDGYGLLRVKNATRR
jgi:hypothetical protein